jgi:hypothetical protein
MSRGNSLWVSFFLLYQFALNAQVDTLRVQFIMRGDKKVQYPIKVKFEDSGRTFFTFGGEMVLPFTSDKNQNLLLDSEYMRKKSFQLKPEHLRKSPTITMDPFWVMTNNASFLFSQASFSEYWQGGGINNLNFGVRYDGNISYVRKAFQHETSIALRHGFLRQRGNSFIKNEDDFQIISKESYALGKQFNLSALISLRTSLYRTFTINPEGQKGNLINSILSPGTFNLGTGVDYKSNKPKVSVYYSPVNLRTTLVIDPSLRSIYLPEEVKGFIRFEMGSLLRYDLDIEILNNIFLLSRTELFANYLSKFGNVDVNLEGGFRFKINNFFAATLLTQFIYDNDIRFNLRDEEGQLTGRFGPRLQFRQAFNMQLNYSF